MPPLSSDEQAKFRTLLEKRREALGGEIHEGVELRETTEKFEVIASETPDPGDASVGAEQIDLRSAEIDRDAAELNQVQAALGRLNDGTFGVCIECGEEIEIRRLEANPSAARCIRCQTAYEERPGRSAPPTL